MTITCTRFVCITSLMFVFCFARESQAQIIGLGDLPGGDVASTASGVSADGSVVVGTSNSANGVEAFRWTRGGGMQGLGDLPSVDFLVDLFGENFLSVASAISADGLVIVGRSIAHGISVVQDEAVRWTDNDVIESIGILPGTPADRLTLSRAFGVSADGSVVVGQSSVAEGSEAFRWTRNGGLEGLGDLPGNRFFSQATGVSADGAVVVGSSIGSDGLEAFRWTRDGGLQGLGDLLGFPSINSSASGTSADGSVVVGRSSSTNASRDGTEAFRWTSVNGMQALGDLPGGDFSSFANNVSADGLVVVGVGTGKDGEEAFVWESDTGMRSLFDVLTAQGNDLSNWASLDNAHAVSAEGRTIVGVGTNSSGNQEAFVATINSVSEPVLLGDINLDNQIDFLDIGPFISLLSSGEFQAEADVDQSGEVDFLDISPFIEILSGP